MNLLVFDLHCLPSLLHFANSINYSFYLYQLQTLQLIQFLPTKYIQGFDTQLQQGTYMAKHSFHLT